MVRKAITKTQITTIIRLSQTLEGLSMPSRSYLRRYITKKANAMNVKPKASASSIIRMLTHRLFECRNYKRVHHFVRYRHPASNKCEFFIFKNDLRLLHLSLRDVQNCSGALHRVLSTLLHICCPKDSRDVPRCYCTTINHRDHVICRLHWRKPDIIDKMRYYLEAHAAKVNNERASK